MAEPVRRKSNNHTLVKNFIEVIERGYRVSGIGFRLNHNAYFQIAVYGVVLFLRALGENSKLNRGIS